MAPTEEELAPRRHKLSDDGVLPHLELWKMRAEDAGLPNHLSNTALMLLYISLGENAWRTK